MSVDGAAMDRTTGASTRGPLEIGTSATYRLTAAQVRRVCEPATFAFETTAELDDPAAEYRRVSAEDLQRVAERYLVADGRAEGLVRGR